PAGGAKAAPVTGQDAAAEWLRPGLCQAWPFGLAALERAAGEFVTYIFRERQSGCSSARQERTVRDREVGSSNLLTPTIFKTYRKAPPFPPCLLLRYFDEFANRR